MTIPKPRRTRKIKTASPDDSLAAFVEALAPLKASAEGGYTYIDRHRDFSRVFATDEGVRALRQIVSLGDKFVLDTDSEREAHWKNAQRFLVAKIIEWATLAPRAME